MKQPSFSLRKKKKRVDGTILRRDWEQRDFAGAGHKDQRVEMLRGLGRGLLCNWIRLLDVQDHMVI